MGHLRPDRDPAGRPRPWSLAPSAESAVAPTKPTRRSYAAFQSGRHARSSTQDSSTFFRADRDEDTARERRWGLIGTDGSVDFESSPYYDEPRCPRTAGQQPSRSLLDASSSDLHRLAARNDFQGMKDALDGQAPELAQMFVEVCCHEACSSSGSIVVVVVVV